MTYLICKKCGKHHQLDEGKSSFNFQKCECGGKLEYSPTSNEDQSKMAVVKPGLHYGKINWKGVLVGFLFLFISIILSVIALFGTNIPTSTLNFSSEDLTIFSILIIVLTIASGSISAYVSGSKRYQEGAINGGLVGVILGLVLGILGGLMVFVSGILVFGLLSMLGGIFSSFFRK